MEENRTGIDRELQMKDRVQLGRSKSRHGIQGTSKRSGTVEKIRKRSSSRAGASAVQEQKVLQKSHTSKSGHPPKHGAVRVPPKTAKAVPAREEKYIGNVGAFSRLHQPVVPAQNTESPYLRSETTKGTLGSKKSAQSSHTMPRLVEKGQTTRPAQRKGASRTVFGGEQLIEATPYGVQGFRASTANGSFKDSRPVVVPRVDRSVQEIDELYNRCQFYDLVSFFGISNSDDPFAQVDNDEDNFTIDSQELDMGSSGSEEESDAATAKQVVQGKLTIKSQAEAKKDKKVGMKQKESESADDIKESWVRDEIIVLGSDAKKNIKGLYKQKIADMKLRRSVYPDRALSYYMEYPECTHSAYEKLNCQPVMLPPEESQRFTEIVEEDGNRVGVRLILPHRSSLIKLTPHSYIKRFSVPLAKVSKTYKAIKQLMKDNGFILSQRKKYNFCWGFSKYRKQDLEGHERFSHFSGCWQVGRKDYLWMNLSRKQKQFPKQYDFVPLTFCLKYDYELFQNFKMKRPYWIIKPVDAARGEGIRVIPRTETIKQSPNLLVSEYVTNPHLIKGYKYDIRVYACVTSLDPLKVYVYREGLVRFCSQKYNLTKENCKDKFSHLTNFTLNKHNPEFRQNNEELESDIKDNGSMKWRFEDASKYFARENLGKTFEQLFDEICDIVAKTFVAADEKMCEPINRAHKTRNLSFELFGFDILVDNNMKPWILECNVGPSMNQDSEVDRLVKIPLVTDMANLLCLKPYKRLSQKARLTRTGQRFISEMGKQKNKLTTVKEIQALSKQNFKQILKAEDYLVLLEFAEEFSRRANFRLVYPTPSAVETLQSCLEIQRANNLLLAKYVEWRAQGFDLLADVCRYK